MDILQVTFMLIERLDEHIPADSIWTQHASGVRGSLLIGLKALKLGE